MHSFLKITTNRFILCAATLSLGSTSLADTYPSPEISTMMFRVDRLPLDGDRMKNIADDLIVLASKNGNGNQRQLNKNAKFLAIAIRLDSKNKEAIRLNTSFSNGESIVGVTPQRYQRALHSTMNLIGLLSRVEKDAEVSIFTDYLKDAMKGVAGDHKLLQDHQINMQRWENVVSEIVDKPKVKQPVKPKLPEDPEASMPDKAEPEVIPEEVTKSEQNIPLKWHFTESTVTCPVKLYKMRGGQSYHFWNLSDFKLSLKPKPESKNKISLKFKPELDEDKLASFESRVNQIILNSWKEFPSVEVTLKLSDFYSNSNGRLGELPVIIQLYASLKSAKIPDRVGVLGEVKISGELFKSNLFWLQLKELRRMRELKQTLFLPINCERELKQLVAIGEADLFLRNEVILAKTINEVSQYFGDPSDENLKLARDKFADFRKQVGTRSVNTISRDENIRASLKEIIALNPNHISARMILLAREIEKPSKLDPYFVAEEFKSTLNSLKRVNEKDILELYRPTLDKLSNEIDEQLKSTEGYIDISENIITKALEGMIEELNTLSRTLKKLDSDYHMRNAKEAHERFRKHYLTALNYIKEKQESKDG